MATPFHTPYDGSSKPFNIALNTLDPADWIRVDDRLAEHLADKDEQFAVRHEQAFMARADTLDAQNEVLNLLLDYLPGRYPAIYQRDGETISIAPSGRTYAVVDYAARPLELAGRLVQDDLVLMRPENGEHHLVAASLCFPSSWSLADKFGKAMADVHEPVPGFGRGGRTAQMIERIFANLKPDQPVERFNWFLYDRPDMFYPEIRHTCAGLMDGTSTDGIWLRVERQSLRKLRNSGDVLFTIQICIDPFASLKAHPDAKRLAGAMRDQILAFNDDESEYKGLSEERDEVVAALDEIAAGRS